MCTTILMEGIVATTDSVVNMGHYIVATTDSVVNMAITSLQQLIRWSLWPLHRCNNSFGGQYGLLHRCSN